MRPDRQRRIHLDAEEARGGEIVLRTPARRGIFFAGLIGGVILAAFIALG